MMTTNSVPEASSSETTSKTTAESVPAPIAFKAKHPLSKFKKNPVLNAGG